MVQTHKLIKELENLAPKYLAETWDNVGLLVGSYNKEVNKILTTLDVNIEIVDFAIENKVDMIISHHPLIFGSLKSINLDTHLGQMLQKIITHNINIYAAHTNLDVAFGGTNDLIANFLKLENIAPLKITNTANLYKVVVYVPKTHTHIVRNAMGQGGSGEIDNYENCSFVNSGTGYFTPKDGANPYIGTIKEEEKVLEDKIEAVVSKENLQSVINKMLKAHPYEVPAYNIMKLENVDKSFGIGRIGILDDAIHIEELLKLLKNLLPTKTLRYIKGKKEHIKKIALCTGAGAEFIKDAYFAGADTYITGDVKYHDAQKAKEFGINLIDAGHFGTEFPVAHFLKNYLEEIRIRENWDIEIMEDNISMDIFSTY